MMQSLFKCHSGVNKPAVIPFYTINNVEEAEKNVHSTLTLITPVVVQYSFIVQ